MKTFFKLSVVFVCVIVLLFLSVSWFKFTEFYKDCSKLKIGMDKSEVELIMKNYINNTSFSVATSSFYFKGGIYITSEVSDNRCNIQIIDDKVSNVELYFEP